MSDMRGFNQNLTPGRNTGWGALRMTQDGILYVFDGSLGQSIEGRVFGAQMGQVTTPLTTAATTALALATPHAWIRVPDGTAIIPLHASIIVESAGATTQGEGAIIIANNDVGNGTSTVADLGPTSLNTAQLLISTCTARQLATAAVTPPTSPLELKRFSFAASAVNQDFNWSFGENYVPAVLRGPATWLIYLGGNAVNYFVQMKWIEWSESAAS